ncbi:VTT domain-containing protein [Bacillus sp. 7894-2]|uniref:VTT domain-containing protein n=1 Tax=Bacillus sp. 7894-2 TaxID=2021695 RepID=UPI000BA7A4ED|nr:VTT domain-containing protein [Bacillus sp. 7894-2]PAE26640.1 TVP38/TMEM64 family protein [Bacillus sp. 7894-2]
MFADIIGLLSDEPILAACFSISMNIAAAITGFLPSAFITAGTVVVFDLKLGLIILIIGEAAGAIISFILYRKGITKLTASFPQLKNDNLFSKLKNAEGPVAFYMIVLLRVLPFVPSGAVTLAAAYSKMRLLPFGIASTIGKVPALFMEAFAVSHILKFERELQIVIFLFIAFFFLIYYLYKNYKLS